MAIELPPLPFSPDALEPHMSRRTLEFHHDKHHKIYVETLNQLIESTTLDKRNLEEIMQATVEKNPKVYNNAAQVWNHTFFWNCLKKTEPPSTNLKRAIEKTFGSMAAFQDEFNKESKELFGSGWTWLTKDKRGRLKVRTLSNAGNALVELKETPLLVCDVWEHAYYLDYQNERPKYLENFWQVVNWNFVESNLEREPERPFRSLGRSKAASSKHQSTHARSP